ncbi:MAG TPA: prenyltransferase/squalene oxidase repeat-containing protein [Nocardioidaceae bacterium]
MFPRSFRPRRSLSLLACVALAVGLVAPASAASAPQAGPVGFRGPADRAAAAAHWQGGELNRHGVIINSGFQDWGLTIDTIFALAADGRHPVLLHRASKAIRTNYYTHYTRFQGTISANAMAKTLVVAKVIRANAHTFGGHDVRRLVLDRVAGPAAGLEQGRLRDKTTQTYPTDFSSTFGQALGVIGLARSGGVPDDVVSYLLRQRCSDGFFRLQEVPEQTCDEGNASQSAPDVDATALAIEALVSARDHGATLPAGVVAGSVKWLISMQKANGSFGGGVATPGSNTNSTGLAAQALAATGRTKAARAAGVFVRSMQITRAAAGNGPATKDLGAIALNRQTLNQAIRHGITSTTRGLFLRSTPQAYFALRRVPLGELTAP